MSKEGSCITAKMKKDRENLSWQEKYYKEHKLRQELEADLARAKEDHQFDNLVHRKELENIRKGKR